MRDFRASKLIRAIALYGALNAITYGCLLPLWEGFDEGFHYGYVQLLSTTWSFPELNTAFLSKEIWRSYELTPVSHYLQPYTKAPINFESYFVLPQPVRESLNQQLRSLSAHQKFEPQTDKPNYEVNQSPLPYLLMAPIDYALSSFSLPTRVLSLRLISGLAAVFLITHATLLLGAELALPEVFLCGVLFCTFSSQMLLAVIAHVSNDCFAVPIMIYLIWAAIRAARTPLPRNLLILGIMMVLALMIKAYFLFLLPLPVCVLLGNVYRRQLQWRSVALFASPLLIFAAPWYARNIVLYHNISGTVQTTNGLGPGRFLQAAIALPWRESIYYMMHSGLWTGNNSFTTFSSSTLNLMLLLLGICLVLYIIRAKPLAAECLLVLAILLFSAGIAFISVAFYSSSNGEVISAVPWYHQVLLVPVLLIAFMGMYRWPRIGPSIFSGLILLWTYVMFATYWVKLIPLNSGFPYSRGKVGMLWNWYLHEGVQRESILHMLWPVPTTILWILLSCVSLAGVALCGIILNRLWRNNLA